MQINIIVKLQVAGLHHWPECPIKEVSYLKDLHRHTFHIECKKKVSHTNRDIEIIRFKAKILKYLNDYYYNEVYKCLVFHRMSCEDIANLLMLQFELNYCSVLEDNEVGAEMFKDSI